MRSARCGFICARVACAATSSAANTPIPPYVVDFYCHELKLVVELDGSQHTSARDEARTKTLKHHGLTVLRFWDNQVLKEMDSVLQAILDIAQARTLTPALRARRYAPPLPKGEGL